MNRIKPDAWLAICATFIALVGLFLSIWSAVQQREHDRLSVKPVISLYFTYDETKGYGWWLSNEGLGPARVVWLKALVDGVPQKNWDDFLLALNVGRPATFVFGVPTGAYYLPAAVVNMFSTKDESVAKQLRAPETDRRVELQCCYCSLYDECWLVTNKRYSISQAKCNPDKDSLGMPRVWGGD
jgi:hypothetical protein